MAKRWNPDPRAFGERGPVGYYEDRSRRDEERFERDPREHRYSGRGLGRWESERGHDELWSRGARQDWHEPTQPGSYFAQDPEASRFEAYRGYYGSGGSYGYGGGFEYDDERRDEFGPRRGRRDAPAYPPVYRSQASGEPYGTCRGRGGYDYREHDPRDSEREFDREERQGAMRDWGHSERARFDPRPAGVATGARGPFYGRAPQGYTRSDERIRDDVCDRLMLGHIDPSRISVRVSNGEVFLEGVVERRDDKYHVEELVDGILGVREVDNRLRVRPVAAREQEASSSAAANKSAGYEEREAPPGLRSHLNPGGFGGGPGRS